MSTFCIIFGSIVIAILILGTGIGITASHSTKTKKVLYIASVLSTVIMAAGIFCGITSKTTVQTVSATVQKIEVGTSWTGDKYTIVHAIDKETGNTYQYLANNLYVSFFPDVNAEDSIEIT